jgi:hypothetical protein
LSLVIAAVVVRVIEIIGISKILVVPAIASDVIITGVVEIIIVVSKIVTVVIPVAPLLAVVVVVVDVVVDVVVVVVVVVRCPIDSAIVGVVVASVIIVVSPPIPRTLVLPLHVIRITVIVVVIVVVQISIFVAITALLVASSSTLSGLWNIILLVERLVKRSGIIASSSVLSPVGVSSFPILVSDLIGLWTGSSLVVLIDFWRILRSGLSLGWRASKLNFRCLPKNLQLLVIFESSVQIFSVRKINKTMPQRTTSTSHDLTSDKFASAKCSL